MSKTGSKNEAAIRSEASRSEEAHARLNSTWNASRAIFKDAANISRQSQALGSQSQALLEKLQRVCVQGQELREAAHKRRQEWQGEQSMPEARVFAEASEASMLLADCPFLEPLPGAIVTQFIRCGKEGCHCQTGPRHGPYYYRVWRDGSVHKKYVPLKRLEEVKVQCAIYLACQLEIAHLVHERDTIRQKMARQRKKFRTDRL